MIQLLDSATDSVFLYDFDGNFVYVNETAYKTWGYTKEELMGMNLHKLNVSNYEKLIESRIKDLMEKGELILKPHISEKMVLRCQWRSFPRLLNMRINHLF